MKNEIQYREEKLTTFNLQIFIIINLRLTYKSIILLIAIMLLIEIINLPKTININIKNINNKTQKQLYI